MKWKLLHLVYRQRNQDNVNKNLCFNKKLCTDIQNNFICKLPTSRNSSNVSQLRNTQTPSISVKWNTTQQQKRNEHTRCTQQYDLMFNEFFSEKSCSQKRTFCVISLRRHSCKGKIVGIENRSKKKKQIGDCRRENGRMVGYKTVLGKILEQ